MSEDTAWPVAWDGVVESVVTTRGPNGLWNVAALGLHAPPGGVRTDQADAPPGGVRPEQADGPNGGVRGGDAPADLVTARTWGRTRTWRNFTERGGGYVQFTRDPVDFVEAACAVREESEPVLASADAWAEVAVERLDSGVEGDTEWTDWALAVEESVVERRVVPTTSRGHAAVVEATVAASRLGVPGYDDEELRERIAFFASVVDSAGGARERAAFERFEELVAWRAGEE